MSGPILAGADTPEEIAEIGPSKRRGGVVVQVLRERPSALFGAICITLIVLIAIFAPLLSKWPPTPLQGPSFCHPGYGGHTLGCDGDGRDIIAGLMYGARVSLLFGIFATLVAMVLGSGVGIASGYYGGGIDIAAMRVADYFLVLPDVPLIIVFSALYGGGNMLVNILIVGIIQWAWTARIIRSQVLSVRERVYVKRSKSIGSSNRRIIFTHILPQVMPLIVANAVLTMSISVFDETVIAFLGLGDPTKVSWGSMIEDAFNRGAMSNGAWWAIVPPGLAVGLLCLSLSLWGQGIEDTLNPRLKVSHLSPRLFRLRPVPVRERV
jgi:peptide/nickel transport system permease protein